MKESATELQKGIFVTINLYELEKLEVKDGYLPRDAYPDKYKEIALENEIGRFLFFRFLIDE
jgi:hypothetical protein